MSKKIKWQYDNFFLDFMIKQIIEFQVILKSVLFVFPEHLVIKQQKLWVQLI